MNNKQPDRRIVSTALLLSKLGSAMERRLAVALDAMELRTKHMGALTVLCAHGAISQQALAEKLGVDASAVVAIVDDLERDRLASRERDPQDRRRYAVHVTQAGRETLARASELVVQVDDAVFAGLSSREREQLLALLLRVAESDPDLDRLIRSGAMTEPPADQHAHPSRRS
ncbi:MULTISPECIES: MarR family transcriptional regulator [unclassified Streptomyces]|uniref:MarR family winged helix-turn-helix transcriptional regulator n=1 Tax=unclassified Streptomyces TaxID=2593676 RepID=UPI000DC75F02|nr:MULTISPECIES: MarR family transcriptional regulator [unclassified Streptomyces]AWZ03980.1 MarR family transcriptional regulator [Streptomyces sp. ICC4]AWZ11492.1 MarR family transcriptional regulator [Streptomyces sp. ICC1]